MSVTLSWHQRGLDTLLTGIWSLSCLSWAAHIFGLLRIDRTARTLVTVIAVSKETVTMPHKLDYNDEIQCRFVATVQTCSGIPGSTGHSHV